MMTTFISLAIGICKFIGLSALLLTSGSVFDWFIKTFTYVDGE